MPVRPFLAFGSLALVALALGGCMYDHGHRYDDGCVGANCGGYPPKDVAEATIDTGATLTDIEPGQGAGAFVEYQAGGKWRVFTACDTDVSKYDCRWDIIVSVGAGDDISDFAAEELEDSDYLEWQDSRSVRLVAVNTVDFDGFTFDATPGASVRVDVYLDDSPAPAYVYWVGDGGLHQGAPTNPIDLTPSAP